MEKELVYVISTVLMLSIFLLFKGLIVIGIVALITFGSMMTINYLLATPSIEEKGKPSVSDMCNCSLKV